MGSSEVSRPRGADGCHRGSVGPARGRTGPARTASTAPTGAGRRGCAAACSATARCAAAARRSERPGPATGRSERTAAPAPGRSQRATAPGRPERTAAPGGSQRTAAPAGTRARPRRQRRGRLQLRRARRLEGGRRPQLSYGQALLSKLPPAGSPPDAQPPNDTSVLLGRLDLKLFAGAETDNTKAAQRLASDMGEFFMPFPGTRVNQQTVPLDAAGMTGIASYYEVKFTDTATSPTARSGPVSSAHQPPRAPPAVSGHQSVGSSSGSARRPTRFRRARR